MKYSELISFDPIESVIQLTDANDKTEAAGLVKSYVMSDDMAEKIKNNMFSQLRLDEVVDNKGVLLVGNYGTGKSHLMSVVSSVALAAANLEYCQNKRFAEDAKVIAGQFEVLRIEIGAVTTPLRSIILTKVQQDFQNRGLSFSFPAADSVANNKETLQNMMALFATKYPDKGYLIVIDEFLDFLGGKDEHAVTFDLGFMREIGEVVKNSRIRAIFGMQEKLFDNPRFSYVSQTINRVRDRFEQVVIRKEDTSYVVSERILKKNAEQKAWIREHLQKFCSLYSNMSERIEEYVDLYPIHPSFLDVFNKIYIIENRHILKNISELIKGILADDVPEEMPGIYSFDSYWAFIKENFSYRTDVSIKEVVEKSGLLEDIVNRSFPKRLYKPLAQKIINALSVHRLTTGDISIRTGLTSENLRDDLCLYLENMPDQSSDTLQSIVQQVLKDIMTTVSGQFIDHNTENGQYYLDLQKDVDYDEKITQRAAIISEDSLNNYFYNVVYYCLDWDQKEHVANFRIYEHTLNWASHNIFRSGYLFLGTPENRPTAQPPRDYYIYFLPPYGNASYVDDKKKDEAFFHFKPNEEFKNTLRLYAAALMLKELAEEKNKTAYQSKAEVFRKKLNKFLAENKNTCFEVTHVGVKKQLMEVMSGKYNSANPFKETIDLVSSLLLDGWFTEKYPEFPVFKTNITIKNQADAIRSAFDRFAGRKNVQANAMLETFGLLDGENISVTHSKYAGHFIKELNNLPAGAVINFNDVYEKTFDDYLDKKFGISYGLLPIVFLGLVYTGQAVVAMRNGVTLTASNLDIIPKTSVTDIYEFKTLSKPKDIQLAELVRLFEILQLPVGQINNPSQREAGLASLLQKAQDIAGVAVKANNRLNGDFSQWGEPLIPTHVADKYKESIKRILEMFSNFQNRFNTVAKLNNFNYSMQQVEQIGEDIANASIVMEYDVFRSQCSNTVSYVTNLDTIDLGEAFKTEIKAARAEYEKTRDAIADGESGENQAAEVEERLGIVKQKYIDMYYAEHQKRRLGVQEGKRKGELVSSVRLANLKRLRSLDILSGSKLTAIENELAALKVCFELTPEMLKTSTFCPKCGFQLNESIPPVKGVLESIEDRIDALAEEWTKTLYNTISDPLLAEQKGYLKPGQQETIDEFLRTKKLPEAVDLNFVNAITELLRGFDPVTVSAEDLTDKLGAFGPLDVDTFKAKISEVVDALSKGKDKNKLRIVVKK